MPDLPAAVETAAFRIAAEAMTNVARHASATGVRSTSPSRATSSR